VLRVVAKKGTVLSTRCCTQHNRYCCDTAGDRHDSWPRLHRMCRQLRTRVKVPGLIQDCGSPEQKPEFQVLNHKTGIKRCDNNLDSEISHTPTREGRSQGYQYVGKECLEDYKFWRYRKSSSPPVSKGLLLQLLICIDLGVCFCGLESLFCLIKAAAKAFEHAFSFVQGVLCHFV
jgi:hypothetical protein